MIRLALCLVLVVAWRLMVRRRRRVSARRDLTLVSREDRSVGFARYPGRLRGGGGL
jgi:hypothetical protein